MHIVPLPAGCDVIIHVLRVCCVRWSMTINEWLRVNQWFTRKSMIYADTFVRTHILFIMRADKAYDYSSFLLYFRQYKHQSVMSSHHLLAHRLRNELFLVSSGR